MWLEKNKIGDISPLDNLTNLTDLTLDENHIEDVTMSDKKVEIGRKDKNHLKNHQQLHDVELRDLKAKAQEYDTLIQDFTRDGNRHAAKEILKKKTKIDRKIVALTETLAKLVQYK